MGLSQQEKRSVTLICSDDGPCDVDNPKLVFPGALSLSLSCSLAFCSQLFLLLVNYLEWRSLPR